MSASAPAAISARAVSRCRCSRRRQREVLADRRRDQVVSEARAAGVEQPRGHQPVAGRAELVDRHARDGGDDLARCSLADHRDRLDHRAVARCQLGQAPAHDVARDRADRRGVVFGGVDRRRAVDGDLTAQLAEQPGVPRHGPMAVAADLDRGVGRHALDHLHGAVGAQRPRVQQRRRAHPADLAEQVGRRIGVVGTGADDDQQRQVGDPPRQVGQHLQRGTVGPVRVVDHERERPLVGHRRAQPEHAVGDHRRAVVVGHRPVEQQGPGRTPRLRRAAGPLRLGRVAQRGLEQRPHHAEREVALERPRRCRAHEAAGLASPAGWRAPAAPSCRGPRGPRGPRRRRRLPPAAPPRCAGPRVRPRARSAASLRRSWPRRAIRWRADGGHYCGGGRRWPTWGA